MIRKATLNDAEALLGIYKYYVENTAITFEYEVPTLEEFRARIEKTQKKYPYIVAEEEIGGVSRILGYAYASCFKDRPAYDHCVESSIYVTPGSRRTGIGSKLLDELEIQLMQQNILNINACIAVPKTDDDEFLTRDSVCFHEKKGYRLIGTFHDCGYKFNHWYDMVWMEKMLGDHVTIHTAKPLPYGKYRLGESPAYDEKSDILSWVDIIDGTLYMTKYSDASPNKISAVRFDRMIGAVVPLPDNRIASADIAARSAVADIAARSALPSVPTYVVAASDGLYIYDGEKRKILDLRNEYETYQRSNDAKIDPAGRLWFGSVVEGNEHPHGGNLYSFESPALRSDAIPDCNFGGADTVSAGDSDAISTSSNNAGILKKKWLGTKLSNGMAWNKAADKFYFSDSVEKSVFVFDYNKESGDISNRRVLRNIQVGVPDGMCIDEDDNIYLAIWGGSRVEHINTSTGELLDFIEVSARHVSSCCFAGKGRLVITSSGEGLEGDDDGKLFIADVRV